jgi:hypothetical protein
VTTRILLALASLEGAVYLIIHAFWLRVYFLLGKYPTYGNPHSWSTEPVSQWPIFNLVVVALLFIWGVGPLVLLIALVRTRLPLAKGRTIAFMLATSLWLLVAFDPSGAVSWFAD